VLPLHGLVSAATGQNADITYWSCSPLIEGDNRPLAQRQFEVFVRWVDQEPHASENTIPAKHFSSIRLAQGESLLHLLRSRMPWERDRAAASVPRTPPCPIARQEQTAPELRNPPASRVISGRADIHRDEIRCALPARRRHRRFRGPMTSPNRKLETTK